MQLEKAIEILEDTFDESWVKYNSSVQNALSLGIEALKLYGKIRNNPGVVFDYYLPGETKD